MKKIKAILVLSAILFLCAFVFAACGPKESGYVGMLQFGNGSWDYSDKVTFNLGKADGSKDLDSYLKKNAGIKNVRFEDYLSQDKTMTVKIKLDTDILDKTFEDEELNAFVVETKALMQNEKVWDKADVFNRAAIRYLGLSGIVMSGGVKGELYKDYYYPTFDKQEDVLTPYYADEWELLLEKSQSPLVTSMVFDWQKFKKINDNAEEIAGNWKFSDGKLQVDFGLGNNDGSCSVETYLRRAEENYPYLIGCAFYVDDKIFDGNATFDNPDEAAFVNELKAIKEDGADIRTLRIKVLEYLELEGHFVYYFQGVVETESGVYSEAGSFECYGNDRLFENWSKIRERRESGLISSVSFGRAMPNLYWAF